MMKIPLQILLVVLTIAWNGNVQSSNNIPQTISKTEQAGNPAKERGTSEFPFVVEVQRTEDDKKEAARIQEDRQEKIANDRSLIKWTSILAIIAFIQAMIFILQACLLLKTISEMKRATVASKQAADASKKYSDMLPQVERAYVHAGGWFHNNSDEFSPDIGNYGKTPAFIDKISIAICNREDLPPLPDYTNQELIGLYLFPFQQPLGIKDRISKKTRKGLKEPIVYGRVWYEDIFDDWHESGFIYTVTTEGKTFAFTESISVAYTKYD